MSIIPPYPTTPLEYSVTFGLAYLTLLGILFYFEPRNSEFKKANDMSLRCLGTGLATATAVACGFYFVEAKLASETEHQKKRQERFEKTLAYSQHQFEQNIKNRTDVFEESIERRDTAFNRNIQALNANLKRDIDARIAALTQQIQEQHRVFSINVLRSLKVETYLNLLKFYSVNTSWVPGTNAFRVRPDRALRFKCTNNASHPGCPRLNIDLVMTGISTDAARSAIRNGLIDECNANIITILNTTDSYDEYKAQLLSMVSSHAIQHDKSRIIISNELTRAVVFTLRNHEDLIMRELRDLHQCLLKFEV